MTNNTFMGFIEFMIPSLYLDSNGKYTAMSRIKRLYRGCSFIPTLSKQHSHYFFRVVDYPEHIDGAPTYSPYEIFCHVYHMPIIEKHEVV